MSKKKILVVDDEEQICSIMVETLQEEGFDVLSANNGVEGLRLCAENKLDLIVLDLMMPRMDGYMFLERLTDRLEKENKLHERPKVLVLSAIDSKKDYGLAENLGATKFMNKPFKAKEFVQTVKDILG